ncbi:DUF2269 family protein [Fictibacillus iocasae]|uniref:DUF2269 family protein n=1 Tax=Fictibacillus iocasae TaxID=2715437 RepID=A0ABW2NVZ3_9BACL
MTLYGTLVLLHVIAAVVGLGASFAMPFITKFPKTVSQAQFALRVNKQVEILPKIGSLTLLSTGLIMGFLHTPLFTEIWFVGSLVIYLAAQVIVAALIPKQMKELEAAVERNEGDALSSDYYAIHKKIDSYSYILHASAVIMIFLMSVKPF